MEGPVEGDEFARHEALLTELKVSMETPVKILQKRVHLLIWKSPGSNFNSIEYLIRGSTLFVEGDLGEAVYQWSSPVDFRSIAAMPFNYFRGKTRGLDGFSHNRTWHRGKVIEEMEDFLKEMDEPEYRKELEESDWKYSTSTSHEWSVFVNDHECLINAEAFDWGYGPNYRTFAHHLGIRMAMERLFPRDSVRE